MAYTYTIDTERGLAHVVWEGEVTPVQAEECIQSVSRDPRCHPSYCRLIDMRAATISIPKASNRELAMVNARTGSRPGSAGTARGRVAIVTADEFSFAVASQYAAYAELQGVPTEVFRTIAAAESWLGLGATRPVRAS